MVELNKSVVVVEDEDDVRIYLSTLFEDLGFKVRVAENGMVAARLVQEEKPDLVTLDIVMPQKTGMNFYRELRADEATAKIPVIIITGLQQDFENFIHRRQSAPPPEGYVSKPFTKEVLTAEVEKVLQVKLGAAQL